MYMKEQHALIRSLGIKLPAPLRTKAIAEQWMNLDDEQKQKYVEEKSVK